MDGQFITDLVSSIRSHSALPTFPSGVALEDAYATQPTVSFHMGQIAGYKAGVTNVITQKKLGLEQPLLGHLYSAGKQPAGAILSYRPHSAIECEIGIIVDAEGRPRSILPVLEFVHVQFSSLHEISAANLVLCNLGADQFMLGQPQSWHTGLEALMGEASIRLTRDQQLVQEVSAFSSLGGPEPAREWMVSEVQRHQWPLTDGTLLITGTCGDAIPFQPGSYMADYGPLGRLEFTIADNPPILSEA